MKKLLVFLVILCVVSIVVVSCGSEETPAETKPEYTSAVFYDTQATTPSDTVLTTKPTTSTQPSFTNAPDSSKAPETSGATDTAITPESTQKPATTTRNPNEGWGDLIPIN